MFIRIEYCEVGLRFHIHEVGAKAVEIHSYKCNYRNVRTDHINMTTHMDLQPFAAVFGCKDENIVLGNGCILPRCY